MEKFVFDVISQTLTITAKFAKMMNDPQSDEYKLVQQFRKNPLFYLSHSPELVSGATFLEEETSAPDQMAA